MLIITAVSLNVADRARNQLSCPGTPAASPAMSASGATATMEVEVSVVHLPKQPLWHVQAAAAADKAVQKKLPAVLQGNCWCMAAAASLHDTNRRMSQQGMDVA